jgi:beta-lactamase regulating signal transducer with metallopeptidase domain
MILLPFLAKATLIITAAAAVLALNRRSSAAFRHLVCAVAIGGLLALPILSFALPAWELSRPADRLGQSYGGPEGLSRRSREAKADGRYDLSGPAKAGHYDLSGAAKAGHYDLLGPATAGHYLPRWMWIAVYLAGVLLLTARLVVDRFKVRRIAGRATPLNDAGWQALFHECCDALGVRRRVRLLRSMDRATPMAIGIRHPAIVVPAMADGWPDEMRRAVLLHELAHIARHDCLSQTAAMFACALYWVHPGCWWLTRRLRIERELACDDRVLSAGTDAHDYAGHLLEVAYTLRSHLTPALAVGMAAPGQIETRMLALLDAARNRTIPTRFARHMAIAVAAVLLLPIAAATVARAQTPDNGSQADSTQTVRAEWARRFLTVDFWRQAAAEGLSRLADQANYLAEMRQLGYSVTDPDVLFKLRQRGVTPDFVRSLSAEGLSDLSSDDLLKAVDHGVSPEYIRDLKGLGYPGLDLQALIRMTSHGIDGDFIRDMRTFGYRWSIDELVQASSHGIDADFVLALSSLGYEHLTLEELTLLRSHGVTPMRIRTANQRAERRLGVNELTTLASHGWKP